MNAYGDGIKPRNTRSTRKTCLPMPEGSLIGGSVLLDPECLRICAHLWIRIGLTEWFRLRDLAELKRLLLEDEQEDA